MNGMQRLVQAEQDCADLHKALAEAIKRIKPRDETPRLGFRTDDLREVLDRTSHPAETEFTDLTPQQARKLVDLVEREAAELTNGTSASIQHGPEYA